MPRKDTAAQRKAWLKTQRAELQFARNLRRVAKVCGALAKDKFDPKRPLGSSAEARRALEAYGVTLQAWAKATAARMVADVSRRDEKFWFDKSKEIGVGLKTLIKNSPVGLAVRQRTQEAAALITSLPLEAAQRIEVNTVEYMTKGLRASELAKRILATGEVTKSRAMLIARTETSRTAGILQEVRAKSVGSEGYIWRTSNDIDVRDRHAALEGKFFTWDKPPITGERGERSHPGGIYNCFTPETLVAPVDGHLSVFRSVYSGEVVILVAGETTIRVTPNHPILTLRGWTPAHLINAGDYLVNVPFESFDGVKLDVDHKLVTFGEMFETGSLSGKTHVGSVDGFYGDIVNQQVDVVVPRLYLPAHWQPGVLECLGQEVVPGSNGRIFGAAVSGRLLKIIQAGASGFSDALTPLLFGEEAFAALSGFPGSALYDTSLVQDVVDCPRRALVSFGEVRDTSEIVGNNLLSRKVRAAIGTDGLSAVRVTSRNFDWFSGHVFTSETDAGYYRVSPIGILAKNCRCWAEVVLPGERRPRSRFVAEAA